MSFVKTLGLKMRELLTSKALLMVLLVLPILLGLTAGAANLKNQSPNLRLAVTDLDQTDISQGLTQALKRQGWDILEVPQSDLARLVDGKAVEGALVIQPGFAARHDSLISSGLVYTPAEGTLSTNMVLDVITYSVIPFKSRSVFLRQAKDLYRRSGEPLPERFDELYDERIALNLEGGAKQEFVLVGSPPEPSVLTYVVNDYSMEVLFLGFFALLGTFTLSSPAIRRRLSATPLGLRYDYAASLITLFAAGLVQIVLYMVSMRMLMRTAVDPYELYILAVFLLMSLALSQGLALLHQSIRLYLGLMAVLLLSVAGGCFIQLPEQLIHSVGQYIPQGWALAALRGYPVPHSALAIALSLLLLALLYPLHAKKAGEA
ncbi:MAG: ABC transporter permease [Clostridiales bacterium]|nr:ABC transporter permease [Clostridiales bacterium]